MGEVPTAFYIVVDDSAPDLKNEAVIEQYSLVKNLISRHFSLFQPPAFLLTQSTSAAALFLLLRA